jgi:probable phosphoglycerate mutase
MERLGKIQGSRDVELDEEGLEQAHELGRNLLRKGLKISKIRTSTQKRAVDTAKIVSADTGVGFIEVEGLEEINLGRWEGMTWGQVREMYPGDFDEWMNNREHSRAHGGESYAGMTQRVLEALDCIIRKNNGYVMVVTRGAVIMCLFCRLSGTPYSEMTRYKTGNTCVVEVDSEEVSREIHCMRGHSEDSGVI